MPQTWTQELDDILRKGFAGGASASALAAKIGGVSRNAVIGRLHRLGLKRAFSQASRSPWKKQEPKRRSARGPKNGNPFGRGYQSDDDIVACQVDTTPLSTDPSPGDRVSLEQLTKITCRWPLGDPNDDDFGFCGCKPLEGFPYCSAHARAAYQPRTSKPRGETAYGRTAAATGAWR